MPQSARQVYLASARSELEHLASENDPRARSLIKKLFVEKAKKLGRDFELLSHVDAHLRRCNDRIALQTILLRSLDCYGDDGHNGHTEAKTLLDCLMDSQEFLEGSRRSLLISRQKKNVHDLAQRPRA